LSVSASAIKRTGLIGKLVFVKQVILDKLALGEPLLGET